MVCFCFSIITCLKIVLINSNKYIYFKNESYFLLWNYTFIKEKSIVLLWKNTIVLIKNIISITVGGHDT